MNNGRKEKRRTQKTASVAQDREAEEMNEADFKMFAGESVFTIADDLMEQQRDMIDRQHSLIMRLMDRIDWLEKQHATPMGIKGL
jgi:hypothetical protein